MVYSGREPGEKASTDGVHVKLLGYKWDSKNDILYPGFAELNLNKKIRGAKKSNVLPVVTLEDAGRLLDSVTLTRRMVVSIMAELYDPCGFWEPWKLQLKLMSQSLAGMDWDDHIRQEDQELWKSQLSRLVDFPTLSIPRICIPADKDSISGIRLICVTDAAINAGGAAVYAGRKLNDSTWSCALVASKSKLMKATVPRNELSAVMLGTELVYLVAKSIGPKVEDIIFATDSTIALS